MTRPYRDDIDWLRAVAVLSVLMFHWDIPPFLGGYVGVDVFFVISGFLITQLIQTEIAEGRFSFARFYERRVRRLLPALYMMIVLIALPSFYYLLPSERHAFFASIAAVVTFTSNILFWSQSGYFDHSADEKLLLHTWSLSVEEQFYLALPIVIWALLRWRGGAARQNIVLAVGLGLLALLSFALCQFLMNRDIASAFFNSPPRAWEFLAGSLIASPRIPVLRNIHLQRGASILGIALVLVAAISYRDNMRFPGTLALLPCAGAALFIWGGLAVGEVTRAPWSPFHIPAFFGRISYSLYLWHWPLFIYAKFSKTNLTLGVFEKTALFAATVAISYASYRLVEQPLRRGSLIATQRKAFATAAISSVLLFCASAAGVFSGAAPNTRAQQLDAFNSYEYAPVYRHGTCFGPAWPAAEANCLAISPGKTNVLLWGDSHAAHYYHGLLRVTDPSRVNILQATLESCLPVIGEPVTSRCGDAASRVMQFVRQSKPDLVILSGDWTSNSRRFGFDLVMSRLQQALNELKAANIPAVVVGPSIEFRSRLPSMLLRAETRHIDPLPQGDLLLPNLFSLDAAMKAQIAARGDVTYVSIVDTACAGGECPLTVANGVPLSFDHAHLTAEGSEHIAAFIARAARLPVAGSKP